MIDHNDPQALEGINWLGQRQRRSLDHSHGTIRWFRFLLLAKQGTHVSTFMANHHHSQTDSDPGPEPPHLKAEEILRKNAHGQPKETIDESIRHAYKGDLTKDIRPMASSVLVSGKGTDVTDIRFPFFDRCIQVSWILSLLGGSASKQ